MKIELRNLKTAAFASHETHCFSATIYINGAKLGTVENEGMGGSNHIHPHYLAQRIDAYAKTLPAHDSLSMSGDFLISLMVEDLLLLKEYRRMAKAKILFTDTTGKVRQTTKRTPEQMARDLAKGAALVKSLPESWKAVEVLNVLPESQALPIFAKGVGASLYAVPVSAK